MTYQTNTFSSPPSPCFNPLQTPNFYANYAQDLTEELSHLRQEVESVIAAAHKNKFPQGTSYYLGRLEDLENRITDVMKVAKERKEILPSMLNATKVAYEQAVKAYKAQLNTNYETLVPQVDRTLNILHAIQVQADTLIRRAETSFHQLNNMFEPEPRSSTVRRRAPLQVELLDHSDDEEDAVSDSGSGSIPEPHPCEEIRTVFCQTVNKPQYLRNLLIVSLVANAVLLISLLLAKRSCNAV